MDRLTQETLVGPPFVAPSPHVLILGAGASRAAFPQGDKNGRCLPLLEDLPEILGNSWANLVRSSRTPVVGFEAQFAWMRRHTEFAEALHLIERQITEYFEGLELPDGPTIYDYLVLGLRPKDTIATFNWDPLLLLAHKRNRKCGEPSGYPFLARVCQFLHLSGSRRSWRSLRILSSMQRVPFGRFTVLSRRSKGICAEPNNPS